jgi:hypothetical protein
MHPGARTRKGRMAPDRHGGLHETREQTTSSTPSE